MQFVLVVAEHAHERRVHPHDPPLRVDERDPGPCLLEDPPEPPLALPEGEFSLLLPGDLLSRDDEHPGPRAVDVQVVPAPGLRLLQPPLSRNACLCNLPVDDAGPLADRREDIKEPPPDQFVAAAAEDGGSFLVQLDDAVIGGTSCIVRDHLIEGITLEHLLKEEAVLLLALPEGLVCPHPLNSPAEPLGDGIDQGAFFGKKRPFILLRLLVAVADLHPPRDPAVNDDRALLLPAGLHEPG